MLILVPNQRKVRVCFLPIFVPKILARKPALFIHETVTYNIEKPTPNNNSNFNHSLWFNKKHV